MKKFFFYGLVFIHCITFCQKSIFNLPLENASLSINKTISKEYAKTFSQTYYYQQENFDLFQNLEFILPNGNSISANFDKSFYYKNGSYSATYKIEDKPYAELVFSKYNEVITGMYIGEGFEKVIFTQTAFNVFAISYVDEIKLIEREVKSPCFIEDKEKNVDKSINHANICSVNATCPGNSTIDLMFVYTQAAKLGWNNTNTVNSNLATIVTNLNQSLILSGVTGVNFNIVHTYEVDYTESNDHQTDLNSLRSSTDGVMDEIHSLRDQYGADLVPLIIGNSGSGCGIGNLNTSTTNYSNNSAFTVTIISCAIGNFTVAHEIGHNMGLRHDWHVDGSSSPCSHHHGYINQTAINLGSSSTSSQRWRTIMAYNNQCSEAGFNCTRQNRWSNPDLTFNDDTMGVPIGNTNPADEAYAFRRMACVVADFKTSLNVDVFSSQDVLLYPNPVKNQLQIDFKINNFNFEIYNVFGQLLLQTKDKTISLEHLNSGIYFLKVINEDLNVVSTHKFIKE